MQENKMKPKRTRTQNFNAEEKMRFVRVLREKGQLILSKVTAHDNLSNKGKEQAWAEVTRAHNSGGEIIRTTETLKKLWGKLKSETKTYKAANKQSVSGTGGGPSKTIDDPVLELVVEMTGRASTGIININDCDEEPIIENENCSPSHNEEYLDMDMMDFGEEKIIIEVAESDAAASTADASVSKSKDRRRPQLNASTERTEKTKQQARVSNRFAAERLRPEQEKTKLIVQQLKQNEELQKIKMQNEKIKQAILEALLKKIQDFQINDHWKREWCEATEDGYYPHSLDPTAKPRGFSLPRNLWRRLNRIQTGHGRCNYFRHRWGWSDNALCECGEVQTMEHIVQRCPIHKYPGSHCDMNDLKPDFIDWLRDLNIDL